MRHGWITNTAISRRYRVNSIISPNQALDAIEAGGAPLVMNNLDLAAEKFPDLADRIADIRAAGQYIIGYCWRII
jgi:hypothetical protein